MGVGARRFFVIYQNIKINVFPTDINIHVNKVCHLISEQILTITTVLIKLLHIHYNASSEKINKFINIRFLKKAVWYHKNTRPLTRGHMKEKKKDGL